MKIQKNLIKKYNHSQNLIVISSYPRKGEIYSGHVGGIASFAKNTVRHMNRPAVVIAEYFDRPQFYEENSNLVIRCFKRNSPFMWLHILKALIQFSAVRNILFQFDFALYGDIATSRLVIPFFAVLKAIGYRNYTVLHSVILDVFSLSGHLGLGDGLLDNIKGIMLNQIFRLFYILLGQLTTKVIVTDEVLEKELSGYIPQNKLLAIPHGVDRQLKIMEKNKARKKLGINTKDQMVLFFGFVNWFKGADMYVSSFSKTTKILGKKTKFIIAGGESATLSQKKYYRKYYEEITKKVNKSRNIEITGFVPQNKIAWYFSACDLVVFPYRAFISASGVLSLVLSYQKPFIVSANIQKMLEASDVQKALESTSLRKEDLVFTLGNGECLEVVTKVLKNGIKKKMIDMTGLVSKERDWEKMANYYERVIFNPAYQYDIPVISKDIALSYAKE